MARKDALRLVRMAVTGRSDGPDLLRIMEILGPKRVLLRLRDFLKRIHGIDLEFENKNKPPFPHNPS